MSTILDNILAVKAEEIAAGKKDHPVDQLADRCEKASPCRNFFQAVTAQTHRRINLIAEIKRKSPSAGVIRSDFDPVRIAQHYQQADAAALSVLTDETFFGGNLDYLQQVKDAVALPVLRKDFIIDPWQVYQSRLAGADAILLIAEAYGVDVDTDFLRDKDGNKIKITEIPSPTTTGAVLSLMEPL